MFHKTDLSKPRCENVRLLCSPEVDLSQSQLGIRLQWSALKLTFVCSSVINIVTALNLIHDEPCDIACSHAGIAVTSNLMTKRLRVVACLLTASCPATHWDFHFGLASKYVTSIQLESEV